MGMFDYVTVECPVDGVPNAAAVEWQTKTFDAPFMLHYRITAAGRLLREVVHYEDRSDPTLPPDSPMRFAGCMTPIHEGWEDMNYHGDLWMIGDAPRFQRVVARFTNGALETIAAYPDPETPHVE